MDDVVEGVLRTMERVPVKNSGWNSRNPDPASSNAPYKLYNIGNRSPVELNEFISIIEETLGKKAERKHLPMQPGDVPAMYANVDDLMQDVGFKPSTPIGEGIRKFINWYRTYYSLPS